MDETEAFETYKEKYMTMHPPAEKSEQVGLGWTFWIALIVVPFQIILAALRTASVFYDVSVLSGNSSFVSFGEAAAAIIAVEFSIVAWAIVHSFRRDTVHNWLITAAIVLAVCISVMAGLAKSISIIPLIGSSVETVLTWAVAIVLGVGASILALVGGELLGEQIAMRAIANSKSNSDYKEYMRQYNERIVASWNSSSDRKRTMRNISSENVPEIVPEVFPRRDRGNNLRNAGSEEVKNAIKEYLVNVFDRDGRIAGPTEVSEAVGTAKSYAYRVTQEWISENSIPVGGDD